MKKNLLLLLFSLFLGNEFYAQSLEKGYEAFTANDYESAITYFTEAKSNATEKDEALVMLSLLYDYGYERSKAYASMQELLKGSTDPEPYLNVLWNEIIFGGYGKLNSQQISLLNTIIKDPKYSGFIKTRANYSLGHHFKAIGDFKKAQTYLNNLHTVTSLSMTGPFENISASGFNKEYDPIAKPGKDAVFQNKNHASVKWFEGSYPSGNWIDFGRHFVTKNSIIYGQTFCNIPNDQDALLSIGTSGSVKLWINDILVFSEQEERNNGVDNYVIPVKLSSGENRILVQIGCSEISSSNFMLRFSDEKGNPIKNITYSPFSSGSYNKSNSKNGEVRKLATTEFFEGKIKENPKNLANYILISKKLLGNGYTNEAREFIEKAQEISPDCSYLLYLKMLVFINDNNRTALSESLEKMRKIDTKNILSMNLEYGEAKNAENWSKCAEILKAIEAQVGTQEFVWEKKLELAAQEKRIEDLVQLNKQALKAYPENLDFIELQYSIEKELNKNNAAALSLLKNYLKKNYNIGVMEKLAQEYFNQGAVAKGMDLIKKIPNDQPNRAASYNTLASVYFAMKDYTNAIDNYEKCLAIAPYVGEYNSDLGLCYEQMENKKDKALEYYKKAIEYYPNDYETIESIRRLEGSKNIWEYFEEPDLYELFKTEYKKEDYPEDNSIILNYEAQRVIYKGGGSETKNFIAIKTLNVQGVDAWKEYYISVDGSQSLNVEKAEIIKANGNRIKAEVNYNAIVYTGLEPGDGVILVYKVQNYYSGKLSENFWDRHFFTTFYPMENSKYQLLVPKGTSFSSKVSNGKVEPTQSIEDDFEKYVWESKNQPSIKSESYMPGLSDVGKGLFISSFPSWDYISKWYTDLAETKAITSPEVKSVVAKIMAGHENDSDLDKAKLIYNYIVNEIRYSSVGFRQSGLIPQKASDVITTRIGDCKDVSTLFVSLCNEIGLKAQLVLVNTRDNGKNDLLLPSIDFNHCISKLTIGEEQYYIELTSDNLSFATMGSQLKNAFSLDITPSTAPPVEPAYLNSKNRPLNTTSRITDIKFDGSKMIFVKTTHKTGSYAASIREDYRHLGKEEQFKTMTEAVSSDYQSLKMKDLSFNKNLDDNSDTVTYTYSFEVSNNINAIGDLSIIKIPITDGYEPFELFSNEKRVYPIELWKMLGTELHTETVTLEMPKGKKLAELPKSVNYKTSFAEYSLTFSRGANNTLIIKRDFRVLDEIIPAEKYAEAQKFFEDVVTADKQQIGFKNSAP